MRLRQLSAALAIAISLLTLPAAADTTKPTPTAKELLAKAKPEEWRTPDPANLLYMQLPQGRVVIELAPDFTPLHAENIRTLVREHYFDGLAIIRVQDNFVTQWGDPNDDDSGDKSKIKPLGNAKAKLPPEYTRTIDPKLPWTPLPDGDVYAPQVGFSEGFPAARNPATGQEWLTHCYGMVGVARDVPPDSGNGNSLYAVIGQAPRGLDRNLAIAGRVIEGMPYLSVFIHRLHNVCRSFRYVWQPMCLRLNAKTCKCYAPTAPRLPPLSTPNAIVATRSTPCRRARSMYAPSIFLCAAWISNIKAM
jgi:cyclophilin family peptidyl-prolyl cis-trans isomerase